MNENRSDNMAYHTLSKGQKVGVTTATQTTILDDLRVIKGSTVLLKTKSFQDILNANQQRAEDDEKNKKKYQPKL